MEWRDLYYPFLLVLVVEKLRMRRASASEPSVRVCEWRKSVQEAHNMWRRGRQRDPPPGDTTLTRTIRPGKPFQKQFTLTRIYRASHTNEGF